MLGHIVVITLKIKPERIMVKHSDEKFKKAEARIAFLEAELAFLKKLDELERRRYRSSVNTTRYIQTD